MFNKVKNTIILVLSLYVVVELSIEVIFTFQPRTQEIIDSIDLLICIIFLFDFLYNFIISKEKLKYFKSYWIDLISSIPFINFFRVLRIARIIRIVRMIKLLKVLRGIKGFTSIVRFLTKNKLRSILVIYSVILVLIIFYCSLAFYMFEKEVNESVKNYFDAIWWAFITVTSVGYGDVFPKTVEGRIFAIILTLSGMGMFSLITAELSSKFVFYLKEKKEEEK